MKSMGTLLPHDPTIQPRDELDRMLQRESQQQKEKLQKSIDIQKLWQLMSSLYGYKWTKAYGDIPDPDKVWQATLRSVSWDQMMKGMGHITEKGMEWPPSAPEFRKICLGEDQHWSHKVHNATVERQRGQRQIEQKRDPELIAKGISIIQELRAGIKTI